MKVSDKVYLAGPHIYRKAHIPDGLEGIITGMDIALRMVRIKFPQGYSWICPITDVVLPTPTQVTTSPQRGIQLQGFNGLIFGNGLSSQASVLAPKKPRAPRKPRAARKPKTGLKQDVTLDSVVMSDEKRLEIRAAISQIEHQDLIFDKWGFNEVFEKGTAITLLFYGVPGTGKTLSAQAIAGETKSKLKIVSTADIESAEPGGAERAMQAVFAEAKRLFKGKEESQVLLFDECDSLLMDRNKVGPILGAQINCLLSEIERHEGIVIFTTNRLGKLDPALERRISAKIEFMFPDESERAKIWKRLIPAKAPLDKDVDFALLATYPLAGGNIKNAVLNAARKAAFEKSKTITMAHFKKAIETEAESLQAFIAAYEDTSHHAMHGIRRGEKGLSVGKDQTKSVMPMFSNNK